MRLGSPLAKVDIVKNESSVRILTDKSGKTVLVLKVAGADPTRVDLVKMGHLDQSWEVVVVEIDGILETCFRSKKSTQRPVPDVYQFASCVARAMRSQLQGVY